MTMRIRTLIVADEPRTDERLRAGLAEDPDFEPVSVQGDGGISCAAIRSLAPDLLFLSVSPQGEDAFEILDALGPVLRPATILVADSDRHALRAFEVQAVDYLVQPFSDARLRSALRLAKTRLQEEVPLPALERWATRLQDRAEDGDLRGIARGRKPLDRLVIKSGGRVVLLRLEGVDWIEAAGNYLRLHVGAETHLLRETMNSLEARLDPDRFLRIHRSTIVNIDRIQEMHPWFHGDYAVLLRDGTRLTLSRGYRQRLDGFLAGAL
jgi:two-component system LytT family response regulator